MAAGAERSAAGAGPAAGWTLAATAAAGLAVLVSHAPAVGAGEGPSATWAWAPSLGVSLAWRLDGLAMLFALLILGFGSVVSIYAARYLRGHSHHLRFMLYLALFMVAMLGVVLADDVIALFVFWELTTLASFLLIGFDHAKPAARRAAWQALLITGAGGLALLAGLLLLASAAGSTRISEIAATPGLGEHPFYPAILTLVLVGAFTKSAQIPFHFWLPGAMAAPTPVSAYLHSATMVKAGVYLLARLHPALSGTDAWTWTLSGFGGATMILAACLALRQTDLKLALAHTSVMALGALVMFLGAEATVAVAAAMTFLVVHALYKAALFLVVGAIDHATGTREISRLGGLWRRMPMTSLAAVLAAGSMAGFPPFLGFIGKELKYEGALAIAEEPLPLAALAVAANAMMAALALVIVLRVVFGPAREAAREAREAPAALWIGPLILALGGLALGIAPDLAARTLVQPAVTSVLGRPEVVALKLWHGVNVPLILSAATLALGIALFVARRSVARTLALIPAWSDRLWDVTLAGVANGSAALTRRIQPGSLRLYLAATFAAITLPPLAWLLTLEGAGLAAWAGAEADRPSPPLAWPPLLALAAAALALAGAALAVFANKGVAAVGGLGAVGTGVAMLFLLHGAPDVAVTQLLVDVLLVVIMVGVMRRLPELGPLAGSTLSAVVALGAGVSVAALTFAATSAPFSSDVADAMVRLSVPEAYGRNIVNVVLVDFRALDTFGEIVVVVAAAIGGAALIRGALNGRQAP